MASKETLTWEDFLIASQTLQQLSENLEENWKLEGKTDEVGGQYLRHTCMRSISQQQELVPLDASSDGEVSTEKKTAKPDELTSGNYKTDCLVKYGSLLKLDEIWSVFLGEEKGPASLDMWSTLSQQDHPILHVPYFSIHPCRTSELMGSLWNNTENPALSYLITWLSIFGGRLGLRTSNELGKYLTPRGENL